jgi:hypothetical protein
MVETHITGPNQNGKFFLTSLIALGLLASVPSSAEVREQPVATKGPIIFDVMTFPGKPDLGLSQELHLIHEWEATLRDEGKRLAKAGSNKSPSARTIEPISFMRVVLSHTEFKYLVLDIEALHPNEDPIAIRYIELTKAAAPNSKVTWWNLGPRNVVKLRHQPFDQKKWQAAFDKRKALVETSDFCILGSYFKSNDTVETWQARHVPRIDEARRLFGAKPIFVALAPHYFDKGKPWPFVSNKLLGEAMDMLADQQVDGIVLWSFEGAGQLQTWDRNWDWVRAVRIRTDSGGRYKRPALSYLRTSH